MPLSFVPDPGGFVPRLVAAGAVVSIDADGEFVLRGGGDDRPALERELVAFAAELRAMLEDPLSIP